MTYVSPLGPSLGPGKRNTSTRAKHNGYYVQQIRILEGE